MNGVPSVQAQIALPAKFACTNYARAAILGSDSTDFISTEPSLILLPPNAHSHPPSRTTTPPFIHLCQAPGLECKCSIRPCTRHNCIRTCRRRPLASSRRSGDLNDAHHGTFIKYDRIIILCRMTNSNRMGAFSVEQIYKMLSANYMETRSGCCTRLFIDAL
jgi:hypothetical protein